MSNQKSLKKFIALPIIFMAVVMAVVFGFAFKQGSEKSKTELTLNQTEVATNLALNEAEEVSYPILQSYVRLTDGEVSPSLSYDSSKLNVSGRLTATEVGRYFVTFTPKEGYKWAQNEELNAIAGTQEPLKLFYEVHTDSLDDEEYLFYPQIENADFTANGNSVSIPTFAYTGKNVTPQLTGFFED